MLEDVEKQSKVGILINLSCSADTLSAVLSDCLGAGGNIGMSTLISPPKIFMIH